MLGDQVLFHIRGSIKGHFLEGRARAITERIKQVAEDSSIRVDSIVVADFDVPITDITAGGKGILALVDSDGIAEGRTRQELASEYGKKLQLAITKYREERSLKRRLTAIIYAVISTIAFIAFLVLLNKLYHKVEARIHAWLSSKKIHIGIQTFDVVRAERLTTLVTGALKVIRTDLSLYRKNAGMHPRRNHLMIRRTSNRWPTSY